MQHVLSRLQALADQAGCEIAALPALVERDESTPPKLIDEYYWVTITKRFIPPCREDLARWLAWADFEP